MRPIPTALLATAAAGALALSIADPASAASGFVRIHSASGQVKTINDPQPHVCHQGFTGQSTIINQTEGTILVFPDQNCRTKVFIPVPSHETVHGRYASFFAVD
ncbi:hypothetical protein ACFOY2_26610 [Nonomuraea purpurea]|uniref:Secreted protein n=1 Tax=Nonomuraea purpurea TaxID=1849276 RepID=A0ABV8GAQ2_9ACTN